MLKVCMIVHVYISDLPERWSEGVGWDLWIRKRCFYVDNVMMIVTLSRFVGFLRALSKEMSCSCAVIDVGD